MNLFSSSVYSPPHHPYPSFREGNFLFPQLQLFFNKIKAIISGTIFCCLLWGLYFPSSIILFFSPLSFLWCSFWHKKWMGRNLQRSTEGTWGGKFSPLLSHELLLWAAPHLEHKVFFSSVSWFPSCLTWQLNCSVWSLSSWNPAQKIFYLCVCFCLGTDY